ncbi:MAG: hypothetical protein PHQ10_02440, partial [Dehalococcoidales bacterium]|nr:hypothetical protein [Dehalococcoidales bacterium]
MGIALDIKKYTGDAQGDCPQPSHKAQIKYISIFYQTMLSLPRSNCATSPILQGSPVPASQ